jgi:uncharacterized protein YkwD
VPTPRILLATVLSILSCTVLTATPGVASAHSSTPLAAAGARAVSARHGRRRRGARTRSACTSRRHSNTRRRGKGSCKQTVKSPKRAVTPPPAPPVTSATRTAPQNTAATIATVLATPCQNTEVTPTAENVSLVRSAILCLINRKRAENGESPLEASSDLEQAAENHCQELIAQDYFAHVSPAGETPVDRIRDTGYIPGPSVGYVIGENLAWGTYQLSTPAAIVAAWIASPGHLANILEAQYRETGIGVTPAVPASLAGGSPGATYAQEFGVIIR